MIRPNPWVPRDPVQRPIQIFTPHCPTCNQEINHNDAWQTIAECKCGWWTIDGRGDWNFQSYEPPTSGTFQ